MMEWNDIRMCIGFQGLVLGLTKNRY